MKKVYVAEDNPFVQELFRSVLQAEQRYETTFFADGLKLYEYVQESPPDLLILDIILPTMSGLAVCRRLKSSQHYCKIPILVISSVSDEKISERVRQVGGDSFLRKPFELDDLLKHVNKLLPPD